MSRSGALRALLRRSLGVVAPVGAAGGAWLWARPECGCKAAPRKRVAIYGGTFDPPTNSHMTCAGEIIHSGSADEVWLIPCGPRPDKPHLQTTPLDRYCMCQIAVNSSFSPSFPVQVSDLETFRETAFYTYDLLQSLREQYPEIDFAFVIGSDWLQAKSNITQWRSKNPHWKPGMPEEQKLIVTGDQLLKDFDFLVIPRPGFNVESTPEDPSGLQRYGPRLRWMQMPEDFALIRGNLSATEIRQRAAAEQSRGGKLTAIQGLIPPGVVSFIRRKELYYRK
ncbi:Probable nicotinate-nucleotide adenylyltransferase (Deamido-NAD(+) diphosphorylase) (Deamido-NAD(+) pyrophosphorylase) (Nicotinate mononucleotide adenylyltransferase) (NaMN adenylyltransferase) [Durusdinium trenchii]|uniref:Probable nicotinate-nucleotide adenylyltransferase (Deamido-NAD(+) diphosphorylase) (Deamido-NAD(+) pyrophosphorylase) (Nicotinate mononucleotide adenylyltransferase) (NaMN adenylyltransferase) n=1 Tax=Durusdinium trenchii TaxID=1381693 RepID=A0ABP0MZY0_9DINO